MLRWKDKQLDKMDAKKIKSNLSTYIVLGLALGAMTFFGVCNPTSRQFSGFNLTGAAAKVDRHDIAAVDFRRAYQSHYSEYQKRLKDSFDPASMQLSRMVMASLVNEYIVYVEALKSGFLASDVEVDKLLAEVNLFQDEQGKFSGARFDQYLRSNGFTEQSFTETVKRQITVNKLRSFFMDSFYVPDDELRNSYMIKDTKLDVGFVKIDKDALKLDISESDAAAFVAKNKDKIKDYYDRNKAEFHSDKKVKARHILVSFKDARNAADAAKTRSKEDAQKRAQQALAEIKAQKVPFEVAVQQFSDDVGSKAKGGDLGFFAKDAMVKEFSDVAFKMTEGRISDIVESPFGFHIIQVEKIEPEKSTTLEQASTEIARKLIAKERRPKIADDIAGAVLAALKKNDAATANNLMAANGLKWDDTGEFGLTARYIPKLGVDDGLKNAIFTMKGPGEIADKAVDAGGVKYILRLKSIKKADLATLTPDKLEEMRKSERAMEAYGLMGEAIAEVQKHYRDDNQVWENPEFRDLDLKRAAAKKDQGSSQSAPSAPVDDD